MTSLVVSCRGMVEIVKLSTAPIRLTIAPLVISSRLASLATVSISSALRTSMTTTELPPDQGTERLQHDSGAPSCASVAVADRFPGEPLGHQSGLCKARRIL